MYHNYENFPEAVIIYQKDKIIYSNKLANRLFCNEKEVDIPANGLSQFIDVGSTKKLNNYILSLQKSTNRRESLKIQITPCGKGKRWIEIKGALLNDSTIVFLLSDITDSVQAMETLSESEGRYKSLVENQMDSVAIISKRGTLVYANEAMLKLVKVKNEKEIIGRSIVQFLTKNIQSENLSKAKMLFSGEAASFSSYLSIVDKEGNTVPVLISASLVKYKGALSIQAVIRDISLIKSQEQQLFLDKMRYRNLLNNLPSALIIHRQNKILFINKKGVEYTGYESHLQILNRKITELFSPLSKNTRTQETDDFLMGRIPDSSQKMLFHRMDGNKFPVHVTANSVVYENEAGTQLVISDISEKEKALERLKETETRLQLLIESSPDIICFKDGKGRWLLANKADLEFFDLTDVDYYGKTDAELARFTPFHKKAFLSCMETDEKAWAKGTITHGDEVIATKTSGNKIYDVFKIPLYNPDKTRKGLVVTGRDVTDRRRNEHAIELQKKKAQKYLDVAQIIMLGLDVSGNITLINQMGVKLLGYEKYSELIGKNWYELTIHSKARIAFRKKSFQQLVQGQRAVRDYFDDSILTKTGEKRFIGWHNTLLFDDQGEISGLLSSGIDITKRRQVQKQMKEQQEQLALIVNKTPALLAYADKNVHYLYVNHAYADFYHTTPEQMQGKPAKAFLTEVYYKSIEPYIQNVLAGNETIYSNERINKKGEAIYVRSVYVPHFDKNKKVDAFLAMIEDVTGLKNKENELKEALEKAKESDRLKEAFLNNLSHEFRTPMNAIIGFTQLLKEEVYDNPIVVDYLEIVTNSTYHLLELINSVIDLSRIETGELKLHHEPVNLNTMMQDLYRNHQPEAAIKELQLHYETPLNDQEAYILSDQKRLMQVMKNLIINAFKFTSKGSISFGYHPLEETIEFFVKDTGIGIPYEQQESVFEHFRQVELSHTRHYGGAGIGLTVCKVIVESLGGKIRLHSIPEKGSSFYFILPYDFKAISPMAKIRHENLIKTMIPTDFSLFKNKTVLLTEDNQDVVFYYKTLLKKSGINLLIATNGTKCLQLIKNQSQPIDLVLMDIRMEDIDGIMLTKKIKGIAEHIPILIQTAFAQPKDRKVALEAGAADFISKPVNKNELFRKMKTIFRL